MSTSALRLVIDNRPAAAMPDGMHVTGAIAAIAVGALAADRLLDELQDGAPVDLAWTRFGDVTSRYGRHSGEACAFVARLAAIAVGTAR